jgi:putative transcriptional regulator
MAREVRMTLEQALQRKSEVDWKKVDATSEEEIRRQQIEDGEDPDADIDPSAVRIVVSARIVRSKLGLSQAQFADLIRVPVPTIRNWEQGRVIPDASAKTLLTILWLEPEASMRALRAA